MSKCVHTVSLIAGYLQCTCDHRGTCTLGVGGPAPRKRDGGKQAKPLSTLCASVS